MSHHVTFNVISCDLMVVKLVFQQILTKEQLRLLNEYQEELLNQKQVVIQDKLQQAIQQAEEEGKAGFWADLHESWCYVSPNWCTLSQNQKEVHDLTCTIYPGQLQTMLPQS